MLGGGRRDGEVNDVYSELSLFAKGHIKERKGKKLMKFLNQIGHNCSAGF